MKKVESCIKCNSNSIINFGEKRADLWSKAKLYDGFPTSYRNNLADPEPGYGMFIQFCLDCGQVQGNFPLKEE